MSKSRFEYSKNETLLSAEGITLSFGDNIILRDVNVEIKNIVRPESTQGQIVGFLGPSGVGKTQFSEILTGLKTPGKHSVYSVKGKILVNNPVHPEKMVLSNNPMQPVEVGMVGMVQQNYPLFEYLTVYKNLKVASSKSDFPKKEREDRIKFYLDKLNLTQHQDKFPAQLSGGQRQRVAIAQQLLCSKYFLVLDEPFSGLDVNMVDKVCLMLQEVANMDDLNTIIIISHDIQATVSISDTLWLMGKERDEKGNIIPGARIIKEIDLISRGLAWEKDVVMKPEFAETIREIRSIFPTLQ